MVHFECYLLLGTLIICKPLAEGIFCYSIDLSEFGIDSCDFCVSIFSVFFFMQILIIP